MLSRAEMPGGGHKPWPQKKQGRHHAGSIRAPGFYRGGFAHGVRGPKTKFTMLGDATRLHGLRTALTIKHCQDDLVIVDDFSSLPYNDPQVLILLTCKNTIYNSWLLSSFKIWLKHVIGDILPFSSICMIVNFLGIKITQRATQ